jgi:quinohemoprotein amine dehydrogenase
MVLPGELQTMCARCHSAARIALQRRDADDWLKHVHWHVAQWPTIEYQQNARDRLWWQTATTEVPGQLGKLFPLHTAAWDDWKQRKHADPAGRWLVRSHEPGKADYWGTALISRTGDAEFTASYSLESTTGQKVTGNTKSIVYTGFEWRGTGSFSGREVREVYAVSEDGRSIAGRWFEAEHSEIGGDWIAVRDSGPAVISVSPSALRAGSVTRVNVFGSGLEGKVSFGPGTRSKILGRDGNTLVVEVRVDARAAPGWRNVSVGTIGGERLIAVYDHVDRLEVSPAYAIARLGGGKIDPVAAQFEAVAYADVPDGSGGSNALRVGSLPVRWSAEPYNDDAKQADDVRFSGQLDDSGRFHPAGAGPNPQRKFSANNAGNLSIVASLDEGTRRVSGKAHLIVTVQRWNTPPIY